MDDAMTALPLVFDAPRRGMPPRHLADLTREEAREAVADAVRRELEQNGVNADRRAQRIERSIASRCLRSSTASRPAC